MLGRSREERNQQDFAALRAEVAQLGDDLRALTGTLHSLGSRNLPPAAARVRDAAAATAQAACRKLRGRAIAAKPGYAAGIAFCVGVALGFVLRSAPREEGADE